MTSKNQMEKRQENRMRTKWHRTSIFSLQTTAQPTQELNVHIIFWWENLVNLVKKKTQIYTNNKILKKSGEWECFLSLFFWASFFLLFYATSSEINWNEVQLLHKEMMKWQRKCSDECQWLGKHPHRLMNQSKT